MTAIKTSEKPTFELKKVSHSPSLSEETNAFTADVYMNGVLLCHTRNDGHGGCNMDHPAKGRTMKDIDDARSEAHQSDLPHRRD